MSLFEKRDHYKPFDYPWAYDAFVKSEQMHWLPREVPLSEDVKDWRSVLSPEEKHLLTNIFRFFTQADVDVAGAYIDHYLPEFKPPEVRMMLSSIAAREGIHIQAYSMLIDEIGMPESEYSQFMQCAEMKAKHEQMEDTQLLTHLEMIAMFSAFGEGLQLFASFVILLNFTRFGKMKGMGQIVSWSIRDETHHVDSMMKLFKAIQAERGPTAEFEKRNIALICQRMVELEDKFIDLAFDEPDCIEGLDAREVKEYIRYIADIRMKQMGLEPIYNIVSNPLPWVDIIVFGKEHTNFFENRATDYAKGSTEGEWDDSAFDFSEVKEHKATRGEFIVWSKPGCPHCEQAQELLASHGHTFDVEVFDTPEKIEYFKSRGHTTFPQIWQGNTRLQGGLRDLRLLLLGGGLATASTSANISPVIPAPQEGASCSLEGDCS